MKRRILTLTLMLAMVVMIAIAISAATTPTAQCATAGSCTTDCEAQRDSCRTLAQGRYNYCRTQEMRSEQDCKTERGRVYNECMNSHGCQECADWRTAETWFCRCGRFGGIARPGINVEPLDYYEEWGVVPYEYSWEGMGCDTSPEICDPTLWL